MKKDGKIKKEKLMPLSFKIWFFLSCGFLFVAGIFSTLAGNATGIESWGAALGIFLMYLIVVIVWVNREKLGSLFYKIKLPLLFLSVFIGWFFAEIDELINFPFNPLIDGISLIGDIILTTPIYVCAHLFWFFALKKYKFSYSQALITGGAALGLYEVIIGGGAAMSILTLLTLPAIIMIHGVHMIMPKIILNKRFEEHEQKKSLFKFVVGIILPGIGAGIGIVIAFALRIIFNIN